MAISKTQVNSMIRYTQFSAGAIGEFIKSRYGMDQLKSCRFFDNGLNDIYQIVVGEETYYYRISIANMHNKTDYEEEMRAILLFAENGINVAKPLPMSDGSYLLELDAPEGKRYGVLFEEAKQSPTSKNTLEQENLMKLGEALARIHQCSDMNHLTLTRKAMDGYYLRDIPLKHLEPYLKHRFKDYQYLDKASKELVKLIEQTLKKITPYYGVCHGDLHSGNEHFNGVNPMIFDFDCMGYGYRTYDIGVYAWNESYTKKDYLQSDEWAAFLKGYETVRKLSVEEKVTLPAFLALRQLWLMGLHADVMDKNAGCCWYNDSYFDEQIGIFKKFQGMVEIK